MRCDPMVLADRTFDLCVIGGGIQGLAIAREAARRGLTTALVEREDFAAGTSSRSSRLIHGGVRYLEHGHFALLREALAERERLLRQVPHLVRPLPMLMPYFAGAGKARWQLRTGLWIYQLLAGRSTLPAPRYHPPAACQRLFPGLRAHGLRGGTLYFDAATQDARLTLAVAEAAAEAGALLCNHCAVTGARDSHLLVHDRLGGREIRLRARILVNAAGPQADAVRRSLGIEGRDLIRTSRGAHLVLPPREAETALAAFLPDGRVQFVIPHTHGTLCGTTEVEEPAVGEPAVHAADVDYLLQALGQLLEEPPDRAAIRYAYSGWRSLPAGRGSAGALNREAFSVAEESAAGTVHTLVGGKLTTHRAFAERTVARLFALSGNSPTRDEPLPGGAGAREVDAPLWWRFGSRHGAVAALADGRPELQQPLCPHRDLQRVELVHAVRVQGARTFADVVLRRLVHDQGPCLEPSCLRALFALYQREVPHAGDSASELAPILAHTWSNPSKPSTSLPD